MRQTVYGILIPFLGTTLGAACVFFMRKQLSDAIQRILTGFAAGVMVAASVWSLLIPAMEQAAWMGKLSFLPAFSGFWIGILFLLYGYYRAVNRPGISITLTIASLGTRVLLSYVLSAIPVLGTTGIWMSIPIGWFLADGIGIGIYFYHRSTRH